jgi:hypothetical protein
VLAAISEAAGAAGQALHLIASAIQHLVEQSQRVRDELRPPFRSRKTLKDQPVVITVRVRIIRLL